MSHVLQFLMGVTWQPVVQPNLRVHRRVRHELAERHRAVCVGLIEMLIIGMKLYIVQQLRQIETLKRELGWGTGLLNTSQLSGKVEAHCHHDQVVDADVAVDVERSAS